MSALQCITSHVGPIRSCSTIFSTPSFPKGTGPDFATATFSIEWSGTSHDLIAQLHEVERVFHRRRDTRWAQRTLDLDLIGCGNQVLPDRGTVESWMSIDLDQQMEKAPDTLILPHPRMHERAFVLVPLLEIAPDWIHPVTGDSVRQMYESLPKQDIEAIKPLVKPEIGA